MTIAFVVGLPPNDYPGMSMFLQWEQERYQDLLILNQTENMNEGKTMEYFNALAKAYPSQYSNERPWDYAMKADDDTLIIIPNLLERLRPMIPRRETYMVFHPLTELTTGSRDRLLAHGSRVYIIMGLSNLARREPKRLLLQSMGRRPSCRRSPTGRRKGLELCQPRRTSHGSSMGQGQPLVSRIRRRRDISTSIKGTMVKGRRH